MSKIKLTTLPLATLYSSLALAQGNWPDLPAPYINGVGKFDVAVNFVPSTGGTLQQVVSSGYAFLGAYEPEALSVVQRYVSETGVSSTISMVGEPSLEALDSEPTSCTPGYTHPSRPSLEDILKSNQDESGLSEFRSVR